MIEVEGKAGGRIVILCGSLAGQTAGEEGGHGIFTAALLKAVKGKSELLALPVDLTAWRSLLPDGPLVARGVEIATTRDALDGSEGPVGPIEPDDQSAKASFADQQATAS